MYSRSISVSVSFHKLYHKACHNNILEQLKRQLPFVRPCYAVTNGSSQATLAFLRDKRVDMVYPELRPTVIKDARTDFTMNTNEFIVRNVADIRACAGAVTGHSSTPLFWIKTAVSNDRIEPTREMFEYIWANKYILNGIVFDIDNFTNGYIPPTMYCYKIAIEYILRNMVLPFEREYGIQTPAIMIDGTEHITKLRHLAELRCYALNETTVINGFREKKPELRLILGRLFDNSLVAERDSIAFHEYP